ncbi:hypothetical protein QN095_02020 [Enterobacter cloacae]|nr:hypothetical protein [Enterobacter cloacae]WIF62897.1 hypothetical protein QN095_02020 [Enterobacter cloacae]
MVTRTWQFENAELPECPMSVTGQLTGEAARISERFEYAGNTDAGKTLNLASTCVSHYDTAGLIQTNSVALNGVQIFVTRHLLKDAVNLEMVADWQGGVASVRNGLLETEAYTALTTSDATGVVLNTADERQPAAGGVQRGGPVVWQKLREERGNSPGGHIHV